MVLRKSRLIAPVLFAMAFGYLEAAVVIYLRTIYQPIRVELHPGIAPNELFPVISVEALKQRGWELERQLYIELGREFATVVMLATVAWGACRSRREWFALFAMMFGVWDIFFYAFLRLLIGWPASILEWDILFLLPTIWTGPVLAPMLVSIGLVAAGLCVTLREGGDRPYRAPLWSWGGMAAGGVLIIVAFCWDWRNVTAGNMPNPFRWDIFLSGLLGGLACFAWGARKGAAERSGPCRPRHLSA
jgi:hypothetical protein